jgi:hypothetical protein
MFQYFSIAFANLLPGARFARLLYGSAFPDDCQVFSIAIGYDSRCPVL